MLLCCCEPCTTCPCKTPPSSLHADFGFWGEGSPAYCESCVTLNGLFEIPKVTTFTAVLPIASGYNFFANYPPCTSLDVAGEGCRYELDEEFDCVPTACLTCTGGCGTSCTADADCSKENCDPDFYSCGAISADCDKLGGHTCVVDCSTSSTCVFDDETDPDHLAGVCTMISCTVAEVTACTPIRRVTRVIIYTANDGKPVIAVYVVLFGLNSAEELIAVALAGSRKFADLTELDCASLGHDITLSPTDPILNGYVQPLVPPCTYASPVVNIAA